MSCRECKKQYMGHTIKYNCSRCIDILCEEHVTKEIAYPLAGDTCITSPLCDKCYKEYIIDYGRTHNENARYWKQMPIIGWLCSCCLTKEISQEKIEKWLKESIIFDMKYVD